MAAHNGDTDTSRTLVEMGADVNVVTTNGRTPVYEAACGSVDVIKYWMDWEPMRAP